MKHLNLEFYKIQCKNWVASRGNGTGSAGITLESLLGKTKDSFILADYDGIELKTKLENSFSDISLFSMALDNKPLQMQRLLDIGGRPDRKNPQYKVFYGDISGKSKRKIGFYYWYKLKVNYTKKVIQLLIFNSEDNLLNEDMSWSFEQLQARLEHKLAYLALIHVKQSVNNGKKFYKYTDISFYKLRGFEIFLKLIESGIVVVNIKLTYHKTGQWKGKMDDKGTTFRIHEHNLEKLFEKIDNNLLN